MMSHTLRATLLLSSIYFLSACALLEPTPHPETMAPQARIFTGQYDEVWRAIQKALVRYPIQLNNIDQGIIETEIIKGDQIWQTPFKREAMKSNPKYILRVNVVKGRSKGKDSVRVTVLKSISLEKDFFSGEARLPSDGLEEKSILYRIEREIVLERSLKRAFEKKNISQ